MTHLLARLAGIAGLLLFLAACSPLGTFNAVIPQDEAGERIARDVAYGEGRRARLDIYAPAGGAPAGDATRRPVLFFIYGGSWNSGDKSSYGFAGRAFAAAGYVTVIADYRLVPGVRYPEFLSDNAAALAWTKANIARYGGDPDRLFVAGHSAGAYNAVMLALAPEILAGVGLGPSDITAVAGLSGPYDFLPLDARSTRAAFGEADDLEATQPINRPVAGAPPMLLVTGDADTLVEPRNTMALSRHLRSGGRRVETIVYPGVDHAGTLLAISRPMRDRAPVIADIDRFFKRYQ